MSVKEAKSQSFGRKLNDPHYTFDFSKYMCLLNADSKAVEYNH